MPAECLSLAVVIGSVRQGRLGPTVAHWFVEEARHGGQFEIDVIDLAEIDLPTVLPDFRVGPAPEVIARVAPLSSRLAAADAFVMVTPEYNHSFPASLKNAIDWHSREWQAKPVGFVSYGGLSGGLRAVEQLRQIFAELHAVTVRDTVSFHGASGRFHPDGRWPTQPEESGTAAKTMLDQLAWWAWALREAKATRPYGH